MVFKIIFKTLKLIFVKFIQSALFVADDSKNFKVVIDFHFYITSYSSYSLKKSLKWINYGKKLYFVIFGKITLINNKLR